MSLRSLRALHTRHFNAYDARQFLLNSRTEIDRIQSQIDILLISRQQVIDPALVFNFTILITRLQARITTLNQQRDRATRTLYQLRAAPKPLCQVCRRHH